MMKASINRTVNRDNLIVSHIFLVRAMARKIKSRLPPCVDYDDLVSAGYIGLVQAADRFNPRIGTSFYTFASYRIRGAMLDMIRRDDWVPRILRNEARISGESLPAMIPFSATGWVNIDRAYTIEGATYGFTTETVSHLLSFLGTRSRRVISMLYLDGLPNKMVAAILKVSPSWISDIEKQALKTMCESSQNVA